MYVKIFMYECRCIKRIVGNMHLIALAKARKSFVSCALKLHTHLILFEKLHALISFEIIAQQQCVKLVQLKWKE